MGARFLKIFKTSFRVNVTLGKFGAGIVVAISIFHCIISMCVNIFEAFKIAKNEECPEYWEYACTMVIYSFELAVFSQGILKLFSIDFMAADRDVLFSVYDNDE